MSRTRLVMLGSTLVLITAGVMLFASQPQSALSAAKEAPGHLAPAAEMTSALALDKADAPAPASAAPTGPGKPPSISASETGTIDLNAQGADLRQVLSLLSSQAKVNIIATKEVAGTVTADLYGVTFTEALEAVLASSGYTYVRKGNSIYVYTAKQLDEIQAAARHMEMRVYHLNYITAADVMALVKGMLSKDGAFSLTPPSEKGVAVSTDAAGGNNLASEDVVIVQDYPENVEKITAIIRELDVPPQQVMIEATIMRATLNENNELGIDFNALAGVDFRTTAAVTGPGGAGVTNGPLTGNTLDKSTGLFRTDTTAGFAPGGLTIGFVSNQISFLIRALETVTDVVVLANPKLLVMNKQRGEVMVGNKDGYLTTTVTETTSTQTVQFLDTGTRLIVRPYIYTDGSVRMEIHPEDSTGGINADKLPYEQTTEVTTNVRVQDGHTIVIGGLFREHTTNGRTQLPLLGNIPVAGTLFRTRSEATVREEVIILITPHIIKQAKAEEVGEHFRDQVEKFRMGARQGLMWFGRDRLAQGYMRWARQHIANGRNERAMWDINMALSLETRMEEAVKLKEQITKQAIWAEETRDSSVEYLVQKLVMQELGLSVDLVVPPLRPLDSEKLPADVRERFGVGPKNQLPLRDWGLYDGKVPRELALPPQTPAEAAPSLAPAPPAAAPAQAPPAMPVAPKAEVMPSPAPAAATQPAAAAPRDAPHADAADVSHHGPEVSAVHGVTAAEPVKSSRDAFGRRDIRAAPALEPPELSLDGGG